ncbi:MAG: TerC family protein [Advenella sp.]
MELLLDPNIWVGLITLIVLELVLGIDNLVFIAILVDKLPPKQRDKARITGLALALIMRLMLLSVMSWLIKLTAPLFSIYALSFSGRDLILIAGGFFLLFKGTLELHERLEGKAKASSGPRVYASFGVIVTQIIALDAIFSLDSIITAVGMVDHLPVMFAAVIIAMAVMLVASKPLTNFVNQHPTVVVLCLGFLLMIGFSLLAEGFGFKVPKGYLYAAIGFSVMIEIFNQIARHSIKRTEATRPMRERTAEGILRMLGKRPPDEAHMENPNQEAEQPVVFEDEERYMVSGVLTLADRSIHSIMTPRADISWINIEDDINKIRDEIINTPHTFFPICRGALDEIIGVGRARDLIADILTEGRINVKKLRKPLVVPESINILTLIQTLKESRGQLVVITDEFGAIEGLVTPMDVFEAIAGEFPDEDETPDIVELGEGRWMIDGAADLRHLEQILNIDGLYDDNEETATLAGYLLRQFDRLAEPGDVFELEHGHIKTVFKVVALDGRRIGQVSVEQHREKNPEELLDI